MTKPRLNIPKRVNRQPSKGPQPPSYDILQVMGNAELFPDFQGDSWKPWKVFLAAAFGLEMDAEQLEFYRECTGRRKAPTAPCREAWGIVGRRGGKSQIMAFIGVFLAAFKDYSDCLAPGEVGTVRIMAGSQLQARAIFRYVSGMLHGSPLLESLIIRETANAFELSNCTVLEVGPANWRSVRGYTLVAGLCDEVATWLSDESANPDVETLAALRPAMLTVRDAMLICCSSPYARRGELWNAFDRWYGRDDTPLVWRAPTRTMNALVEQSDIDKELERDPERNRAEYLCEFRTDVEQFVSIEAIRLCIDKGVYERPPELRWRYYAGIDPSGGSVDSMTLSICHREGDVIVEDFHLEVKPSFNPEAVIAEFSAALKRYRILKAYGDRVGNVWLTEWFKRDGIFYDSDDMPSKSEQYLHLLPRINATAIRMLDRDRTALQLARLERRTARGGRDTIDHPRGEHDDCANALALAVYLASSKSAAGNKREEFRIVEREPVQHYSGSSNEPGVGWMAGPIRKWPRSGGGESSGGGWMGR